MLQSTPSEFGCVPVVKHRGANAPAWTLALDPTSGAGVDQGVSTNWAFRAVTRVEWPQ